MKTFDGYKKQALTNVYALLAGGGHKPLSDFATSGHNHDGRYLRYFRYNTSPNADSMEDGWHDAKAAITNAPTANHGTLIQNSYNGTPFQIFIPDASYYIYKRYKSGSIGGIWTKIYAGYADSAGNASTATKLTSSAGNTALPIYFSNGKPVACIASSIFSNLSNNGNNLSITIAGQNRTLMVAYANNADTVDGLHYNRFVYNITSSYNRNGPYYKKIASVSTANWTWASASLVLDIFSTGYSNGICYLGTVEVICGHWNNTDHNPSVTCRWILKVPNSKNQQVVAVKNLNTNTIDVYLLNDLWDCQIIFNVVYNNNFSILSKSLTDEGFVNLPTASSTIIHYVPSNPTYVGNSTSATNSDTVDGYHANGLLTALSNSNNGISITVGGTTKSISNISVNYANSAGSASSATKVIVNLHTTNDINYPLVWSNLANSNTITENQLFKSWSDLYYNPKNKRLTVGGSVVASSFVKSGGTSLQLLRADGEIATFNWSGQSGLPTWLWGGNNLHSYYVYNPSNFRVAYASSSGNADTVDGYHASKFPYINDEYLWRVYGKAGVKALADNTAGLSTWAFGETRVSSRTYLGILKPYEATCGITPHGIIVVCGKEDTHLGLAVDYYLPNLQVFGGNADKIVWRKKVAFADGTGVSGTWGISITGNAATASKLGTSTVGATNIPIYLNGGTPTVVNLNSTANNLINNLTIGTSTPTDADYYVSQYVGGSTTTTTFHRRPHSSLYAYIKGKAEGTWSISITGNAATATNADKVDGYHASSLWRSDGATWNPGANVSLNASANNQEWSFDIRRNGYTGCYWHVWDSALSTMLRVNADNGKVYAPYNFVGNLEGNASSASKWLTARTFTIGNTSKNVDGSSNVSWSLSEIGAASSSHGHNYAANENYGGFTKSGRLPISGFYQSTESESGGNAPWTSWMHLINCQHSNGGNNYALLIAASFYNNNTFKIRVTNGNVNNSWRDIIHSGNIGSQSVNYANSAGNADTLDGLHANAFATASHSHPYLPLSGGTMTGLIVGNNKGGSWILGRANAALYLPRTTTDDWHPVVGFKTKTGSWEFGNVGNDDFATFSWESDSNYSSGTNTNTRVNLRAISGTIALTSDIPTKSSWNYDDRYSKLGHTHDDRYYTESEINNKLGAYLPLSGGTMTGALNFKNGTWNLMGDDAYIGDCNVGGMIGIKGANAATPGFALYNNSGTLLGKLYASGGTLIWSGGTIQATTFNGNATTASNADKLDGYHASSFATSSHTHSYITIPTCSSLNGNSDNFSVEYAGGNNSVATKPSGVDAFGVMRLRTAGGWYGQILMSANTAPGIYYRNANGLTSSIGWIKLLDSSNSSVSGGGSAWGSSITVKINGTSKTLAIPSNPNTDYRVTQSDTTTTNYRPLVLGYINVSTAGSGMTGSVTNQVYLSNKFYVQPSTGNLYATTFVGSLSGNASSATSASKWTTARTLTLTGSVTGSVYIDGSSNVTLTTTTNHTHNWTNIEGKPNTFTPSFHTHDDRYYTESEINTKLGAYLPLSGGTMNANARISFNDKGNLYIGTKDNSGYVYFQDMASQNGTSYWYISQDGNATFKGTVTAPTFSGNATTATTASKLGSSTVGSGTRHFYLNAGMATASSSTVGGTAKPMYLNAGTMTAISATVGSASKPVYLKGGTITACSSSLTDYLPLTGGSLSGDLYVTRNTNAFVWAKCSAKTAICMLATSSYVGFQCGNYAWNGNVPMYITGPGFANGSTLYLKFSTVDASGNILASHFYENSDIRYKKILKNLSINSNTIANLPLFDFEWIENNAIGTGTSALAVQQILPNLVSGTDKLTLDYGVLGTIAGITACKELVTLKSELLQLKEKVKLLEDKLRKYENI